MNEEKINKFIEDEMDDGLGVQFIDGERFFGIDYKYDGGISVFDKTQQIIDDCDWWDVIPMNDTQIIQLLNELYVENEQLKQEIQGYEEDRTRFEEEARTDAIDKALDEENEQLKRFITSMGFTIKKENGNIIRLTKEDRK